MATVLEGRDPALTLTMPLLTLYADFLGIFGGLVVAAGLLDLSLTTYGASAVGDAATSAVVTAIVLIIVVDGVFAVACHLLGI